MDFIIKTKSIFKSFASLPVLQDWNLTIKKGERIVILGPSGSGKTTFLRIIAGLEGITKGEIKINTNKIGFVFQEPRLIPWRTVKENIAFVNEKADIDSLLKKLNLENFGDFYPRQLSGGMKQRANLARALASDPDILILDEAFASLDWPVKLEIMQDIVKQWQEKKFTLVAVTHDLKEALYLADRIIILSGRPAKIKHDIDINLSENRSFSDPELLFLEAEILRLITH